MKTTVERLPDHPARVVLEVEVEPERVEQAVDRVYRRVVRDLRIPGFRKGRAPRKIVEMYLGKDALLQEAIEELVPAAYREAAKQAEIDPVSRAQIDIIDFGEGKPLTFKAEVDVKPEVTLGEYKGLAVEKHIRKVTDADVERVLERIRQNNARLETADKEAVEEGDYAVIDFDGYIDGEPFRGGAGRGELVEVTPEAFVPGFAQQLIGMKPGEEREVTVTFPEDAREDLAGKEATFSVRLQEIKVRVVPELDDELAKTAGDFETLEELRADARRRLEEAAAEDAASELEARIIERVTDAAAVDIPEVMIEQEIEQMIQEFRFNLAASGWRLEDYLEVNKMTEEQLAEEFRPGAERRVKSDLVLEAIARAENLDVTEEEVDERMRLVLGPGRDEKELAELMADEDRREVSRLNLLRLKAVRWLIDNADVTEVEYEPEEAAEEEAAAGDEGAAQTAPKAAAEAAGGDEEAAAADADAGEAAPADETGKA